MFDLRLALTACALAAAMVLAGMIGARQRVGSVLLVLLAGVWLTVDRDFEGPVLITLGPHHGLVTSDLVGLAGIVVAAWQWGRHRRR